MTTLQLKPGTKFIGGSLFSTITMNKHYPVIDKYRTYLIIRDDDGTLIHVSRTALRQYFTIHN